jgi:hypothetical protein
MVLRVFPEPAVPRTSLGRVFTEYPLGMGFHRTSLTTYLTSLTSSDGEGDVALAVVGAPCVCVCVSQKYL